MAYPRYPVHASRHSEVSAAPVSELDRERQWFELDAGHGAHETVERLLEAQDKTDHTVEFPFLPIHGA
jgi:hypothetical protein